MPVVGLYPVLHLDGREAEREQAAMATVLADAAMLGARVVKCFAGRLGSAVVDAAAYDRSVAFTRALADEAARHGLVLTAETHPDTLCDTVAACRRFLQDVRAPNLRLCYQPFDFTDTDRTVADYEALRDVVVHVHLQGRAGDRMVWLEDADIAYGSLIDALAADGFEGFACIEFVKDCVADDPADFDLARVLANAGRDRAFIHGLAAQAGLTLED